MLHIAHIVQGVQDVKDLKNNLLSIGQLDDLECKNHIEGGILKLLRENLVLMKADKIIMNLYVLMGDMLQKVNVTVALTCQEEVVMTWHHRLSHMSE